VTHSVGLCRLSEVAGSSPGTQGRTSRPIGGGGPRQGGPRQRLYVRRAAAEQRRYGTGSSTRLGVGRRRGRQRLCRSSGRWALLLTAGLRRPSRLQRVGTDRRFAQSKQPDIRECKRCMALRSSHESGGTLRGVGDVWRAGFGSGGCAGWGLGRGLGVARVGEVSKVTFSVHLDLRSTRVNTG
jgi:hypothetical protein